ncbi:MAG: hypothetical protein Kow0025_11870 [Thermodesulfovibrionales bacterium]
MNRRVEDLHPSVRGLCRRLVAESQARGIGLVVTSTLRTEAEQLALFAQGRKGLETVNGLRAEAGLPPITAEQNRVVTRALASVHQFGLAFDVAVVKDGRAVWDLKADINGNGAADYEEVGRLGKGLGLEWGGDFAFKDYCHFQLTRGLSVKELREGKRPEPPLGETAADGCASPLAGGGEGAGAGRPRTVEAAVCHAPLKKEER